jgi:hypothetical protein
MAPTRYDILKKEGQTDFVWIDAVRDLQTAKARVQELSVRSPGQYTIFEERSQKVVAGYLVESW